MRAAARAGICFRAWRLAGNCARAGCAVTLLVSSKEIDAVAAKAAGDMKIVTLPAVGLSRGNVAGFAWRFGQSYFLSRKYFRKHRPQLVLGMGGFTSAPPVLAGKHAGARAFLHESNSVPGRANRFLARVVDGAFVYFQTAADELSARQVERVGMPVRPEFLQLMPAAAARSALGLKADAPVLLVMGGSQGAGKINELIMGVLPQLRQAMPQLQFIHLTGSADLEKVRAAYAAAGCPAVVRAFLGEMAAALAAADAAVSRAGASSLAELAACQLPAILIPYPTAADNHQFHNAPRLCPQRRGPRAPAGPFCARPCWSRRFWGCWEIRNAAPPCGKPCAPGIVRKPPRRSPKECCTGAKARNRFPPPRPVGTRLNWGFSMSEIMAGEDLICEELRAQMPQAIVRADEPLAKRTTLRVGGCADIYVEPSSEKDLGRVLEFCRERGLPFLILGRGSNLLIRDAGVRGVVISLNHPAFCSVEVFGRQLCCGGGAKLKAVCASAREAQLTGLEFLEGIPGSVGGALRMNAGAMGGATFSVVTHVRFMDQAGEIHEFNASRMNAGYRSCPLLKGCVALGATFQGEPSTREIIDQRSREFNQRRWQSQPKEPSAGCIFKNPSPTVSAGKAIDEAGLKGARVGGAVVSAVHANFITNDGTATAHDVLELIDLIQTRVLAERGIELHTEVEIIGEDISGESR